MNRTLSCAVCLAVPLLSASTPSLPGAEDVFVGRFETGLGKRWSISTTLDPPGLRWHCESEEPGFHFNSVAVEDCIKGHG